MEILLEQRYWAFTNTKDATKTDYTFTRVPNIQNIYGKAKTILERI